MLDKLLKAYRILCPDDRRKIKWLLVATILMAMIEVSGIASIFPFIAVVMDQSLIEKNEVLSTLKQLTGIEGNMGFLFFLGVMVFFILAAGNIMVALVTYLSNRFSYLAGHNLSVRLLGTYMKMPYAQFLVRNPSELNKNIQTEVLRFIVGFLNPAIRLISRAFVTFVIFFLLLAIDWKLALTLTVILGSFYVLVFLLVRKRLGLFGKLAVERNRQKYALANEIFGGLKEIRLTDKTDYYLGRYTQSSRELALRDAGSDVISLLPRYILETIAFGGMLGVILYYIAAGRQVGSIIPVISLYAFAGYRLLPSLQQIYNAMAKMKYNTESVELLYSEVNENEKIGEESTFVSADSIRFDEKIELKDIQYYYPGSSSPALKGVNIEIRKGQRVAIIGETGSGKSTIVDILLGLLWPSSGEIIVDGKTVTRDNLKSWQKHIAYVPQAGYISEGTVRENIAFGIDPDDIDDNKMRESARIAVIHDFIETDLSQGYDTTIGERGVKLSGGQRQRILLARALYRDADVIVLDEATSALDSETEKMVMESIRSLSGIKTIIMITHRISSLRCFDRIFVIENGECKRACEINDLINHG